MAVLAPQDWHPPRDHTMDSPSANTANPAIPRQRVSPANDHSPAPSPVSPPQGQPYPYPVQQQQAGWNANAPPFYPSFYQNPHQQPYPIHPQQGQIPTQNPYFDPNAQQFAQWAYHQMMFNAQQQAHLAHTPSPGGSMSQRGRSPSATNPAEYFAQNQLQSYGPFASGTPPPHPSQQLPNGYRGNPAQQQQQYDGFHPYRRPNLRQGSHSAEPPSQPASSNEWRPPAPFQPPYARADAAGSTTSVNSTGSASRQRTGSLQGTSGGPGHRQPSSGSTNGSVRGRSDPSPPVQSPAGSMRGNGVPSPTATTSGQGSIRPHHRNGSSSSSSSSVPAARPPPSASPSIPHAAVPRPTRPSPLSQGSMSVADKRKSRDDSELMEPIPTQNMVRSGGLKGRLRRALSLSAAQAISEENAEAAAEAAEGLAGSSPAVPSGLASGSGISPLQSNAAETGDGASTTTRQTKKKSRTALFNSRLNASTDNISLSSTMSSASVVIRKLGSIGKLARRNSLAGITSLFKDKEKKDKDDPDGGKKDKGKKKKGEKGEAAEASISHVTAELDRGSASGEWSAELNGLSPAAKLARQHTLKSNAEAAAAAKARAVTRQEEEAAANATTQEPVPPTWEKNTTTRAGEAASPARVTGTGGSYRVNEEGMRVIVEDDDSASEGSAPHDYSSHLDGWDDEDWSHVDDEDDTIRQGLEQTTLGDDDNEESEPWAVGVRRSEERTRQPAKGILKNADNYDQHVFMDSTPNVNRARANSYNSPAAQARELGPLARIPSPDPDHIDGLRHPSHTSNGGSSPSFIPPFSFDNDLTDSPEPEARPGPEKTLFNHPNLNSSAPVLSAIVPNPPTLSHRSATAPASKRLAFASNLSVYDTFPATVYDRRSEPATWSRLTPALAQRIKEELNSYKMEEMEVHASSRIHTQFFV